MDDFQLDELNSEELVDGNPQEPKKQPIQAETSQDDSHLLRTRRFQAGADSDLSPQGIDPDFLQASDFDTKDETSSPDIDWQNWLGGPSNSEGASESVAVESDWVGISDLERPAEIDLVVYVGVALDVVQHVWAQYCLGEPGQFPLHKHLQTRGLDAKSIMRDGRWQYLVCANLEEAEDFHRYLKEQLQPLLYPETKPWNAQNSVWYQNFLYELQSGPMLRCDDLIGRPSGPGVYVFYHTDQSLWQITTPEPQEQESAKDYQQMLRQAVRLSQTSQPEDALPLLAEVIKHNPHNDMAWLWYAYNLPAFKDRIKALEECLFHNPHSVEANNRLQALKRQEEQRLAAEQHRANLQKEIVQLKGQLQTLADDLYKQEGELAKTEGLYATAVMEMERAERNYAAAKDQVAQTKRKLAGLESNLEQLQLAYKHETSGPKE